jgi:YHS domain-containing protein
VKKLIPFLVVVGVFFSGIGFAEEAQLNPQTVCPVMGGKINKDLYIDYQGQRIYLCCPGCKQAFLKEPEKYMKVLAENKILLESIQKTCPVMGGEIDKNIYIDYKGRRVYFCCASCKEVFAKDPEKYLKKLPGEGK